MIDINTDDRVKQVNDLLQVYHDAWERHEISTACLGNYIECMTKLVQVFNLLPIEYINLIRKYHAYRMGIGEYTEFIKTGLREE